MNICSILNDDLMKYIINFTSNMSSFCLLFVSKQIRNYCLDFKKSHKFLHSLNLSYELVIDGHINLFEWIATLGYTIERNTYVAAVIYDRLDIIQWLIQNNIDTPFYFTYNILKYGRYDIYKWCNENTGHIRSNVKIPKRIDYIYNKDLSLYLLSQQSLLGEKMIDFMIINNDFDSLNALHPNNDIHPNCTILDFFWQKFHRGTHTSDPKTIMDLELYKQQVRELITGIKKKEYDTVKNIIETCDLWNSVELYKNVIYCIEDDSKILDMFLESKGRLTVRYICDIVYQKHIIKSGYLNMLMLLKDKNILAMSNQEIAKKALYYRHIDIIKWICQFEFYIHDLFTYSIINTILNGEIEIIEMLKNHFDNGNNNAGNIYERVLILTNTAKKYYQHYQSITHSNKMMIVSNINKAMSVTRKNKLPLLSRNIMTVANMEKIMTTIQQRHFERFEMSHIFEPS